MANIVHVVGTGTIGEPVIGLIAKHMKELGIDEVTFSKHSPKATDRPMVNSLLRLGAKLTVAADKVADFEKIGLKPSYTNEVALERATAILDCSPNGLDNKAAIYDALNDGKRVFLAQGSEDGFGRKYALGINDAQVDPATHKFIHIVSCNTHNISVILKDVAMKNGASILQEGRFVAIRRAGDISDSKFIQAPSVDKHKEARGTHHATDVHDLFKTTMGIDMDVFSSALKLPTAYMHTLHFTLKLTEPTTLDGVIKAFQSDKYVGLTDKKATNEVFSFGRDHGQHGRILSQTVIVTPTLHVSDDGRTVTGFAFTPQDGNSLLTTIAVAVRAIHPDDWKKRMSVFDGYLLKEY